MFKEALMKALTESVKQYNETSDPDKAIIKIAAEHDFNIEQTKRLVESFNTAHAVSRYGLSKTASEAAKSFKLANSDIILGTLFDPKEITKESSYFDTLFSDELEEYAHPEKDWSISVRDIEKSAELFEGASTLTNYDDLDYNTQLGNAVQIKQAYDTVLKQANDAKRMVDYKYEEGIRKIASELNKEWPEFRGEVLGEMLKWSFNKYGEGASIALLDVAALLPKTDVIVKTAGLPNDDVIVDYKEELENVNTYRDTSIKLANDIKEYTVYADRYKDALNKLANEAMPDNKEFVVVGTYEVKQAKFGDKDNKGDKGPINDVITRTNNAVPSKLTDPAPLISNVHKGIGDIQKGLISDADRLGKKVNDYDAQLEQTGVIQDLMLTDPILSAEDPKRVAELYESMIRQTPNIAKNKEVMRSILRAAVQTEAIDAYDQTAWLGMEKARRELDGTYVSKSMKINEPDKSGSKKND